MSPIGGAHWTKEVRGTEAAFLIRSSHILGTDPVTSQKRLKTKSSYKQTCLSHLSCKAVRRTKSSEASITGSVLGIAHGCALATWT